MIPSSERIKYRQIDPESVEQAHEALDQEGLMRFYGFKDPKELAIQTERMEKGLSSFDKSYRYFHLLDPSSGNMMGWCGFHTWYTQHARAEIGYWITDESRRGEGLMTEAMKAILHYGFEVMRLHRMEAFIGPDNFPSLKLVQRFGFQKEGVLREHYQVDGRMEDSVAYGLLRHEFENN
jgi:ribosomal-protein-alanine N-acetyltransferase